MDSEQHSGTSKDSEERIRDIDGSGSYEHSESDSEDVDESGSSNHILIYPRLHVRIGSNNSDANSNISDGSADSEQSELHTELTGQRINSQHSTSQPFADFDEGDLLVPAVKVRSSSSSSSLPLSLDGNSTEDFNPRMYCNSSNKPHMDTKTTNDSINNSSKSEERDNVSSESIPTSSDSDIAHGSAVHSNLPTQRPPTQVMDRSAGYDPLRIPSSVFERKTPITPQNWSVASNESLFSIHVGNNSFSGEQFLMFDDLSKSGKLGSTDNVKFSPQPSMAAVDGDNQLLVDSVETNKQSIEALENEGNTVVHEAIMNEAMTASEDKTITVARGPNIEETRAPSVSQSEEDKQSSASSHDSSIYSAVNTEYFSLPIKKRKCTWQSCYCFNCSWPFCYCRDCKGKGWCCQSCNCSWVSHYCCKCSGKQWCCHSCNCSWVSRYCCNYSRKQWCCHSCNCSWVSCYCCNCSRKQWCCHSCNCSWVSPYCCNRSRRQLCCHSCSCSWMFTYCWNCSGKRWCCLPSTTLSDEVKRSLEKSDVVEEQEVQKPRLKVAPRRWFSYISCWPWGWSCRLHCC